MNKNSYIVLLLVVVLGIAFWVYRSSDKVELPENNPAIVFTQSVIDDTSTATAVLAGAKTVTWQTDNYPANVGVNINLIKMISESPKEFAIVRTIAIDTPNDGQETWELQAGENTDNLYIEVTCSGTYQFHFGCNMSNSPIKVD